MNQKLLTVILIGAIAAINFGGHRLLRQPLTSPILAVEEASPRPTLLSPSQTAPVSGPLSGEGERLPPADNRQGGTDTQAGSQGGTNPTALPKGTASPSLEVTPHQSPRPSGLVVKGRLIDNAGQALGGIEVSLGPGTAVTQSDGTFLMTDAEAGEYPLSAVGPEGKSYLVAGGRLFIVKEKGTNDLGQLRAIEALEEE